METSERPHSWQWPRVPRLAPVMSILTRVRFEPTAHGGALGGQTPEDWKVRLLVLGLASSPLVSPEEQSRASLIASYPMSQPRG